MMLIASLIELPIAKMRMWQKHKTHLGKFYQSSLRVICFRWGPRFQREVQLKQLEQFLEQNPTIARETLEDNR